MEKISIKATQGVPFDEADSNAIKKGADEGYTFKRFPFNLIILARICSISTLSLEIRRYYIEQYVNTAPHYNQIWPTTHNCVLKYIHAMCHLEHFEIIIRDIISSGGKIDRPTPSPLIIYSSIELFPMDEAYVYDLVMIIANATHCKPFTYIFKDNTDFALMAIRHYIFHVLKNTPTMGRSLFRDTKNMDAFITNTLPFDLLVINVKAIISQHKLIVNKRVSVEHGCINMALSAIID
jgi:hypothetical protein